MFNSDNDNENSMTGVDFIALNSDDIHEWWLHKNWYYTHESTYHHMAKMITLRAIQSLQYY